MSINILEMLLVIFAESAIRKTSVNEWYKRLEEGREDIEKDEHLGRLSISMHDNNVKKVRKIWTVAETLTICSAETPGSKIYSICWISKKYCSYYE